jgi:hypothetical protein
VPDLQPQVRYLSCLRETDLLKPDMLAACMLEHADALSEQKGDKVNEDLIEQAGSLTAP